MITQFGGKLPAYGHVTVGVKSNRQVPLNVQNVNTSAFFDYFSVKYLHQKYGNLLCAVPFWLRWNAVTQTLTVPEKALFQCWTGGAKYVFQPVEISTRTESHANAIIIDVKKQTAERFEPHGAQESNIFPSFNYAILDQKLESFFKTLGVTYLSSSRICPYVGPQYIEDFDKNVQGFCAAWSLWYVDMRMKYPDVPQRDLIEAMTRKAGDLAKSGGLREYLWRFLSQVYQFMYQEYPQYEKFFTRYDYYMSHPTAEFDRFLNHMENLVKSPEMLLVTERRMQRRASKNSSAFVEEPTQYRLSKERLKLMDQLLRRVSNVLIKIATQ